MTTLVRPSWRNCAIHTDSEILEIDLMEDSLAPIDPDKARIRELISTLELCHHKADRWVDNIIGAIGSGKTRKGLGTRLPAQVHTAEKVWQNACTALSAWCAGSPGTRADLHIGAIPASQLLAGLGLRSALKEWQVQRVIEKIRSVIHWPQAADDPTAQYEWILLGGGEYELAYRSKCPEHYKEHEDFWLKTVKTIIHDTENGNEAELSLGLAIDMLWPCHWMFVENLQLVLEAIGGKINPEKSYAACGRNTYLFPNRGRMEIISQTLEVFYDASTTDRETDNTILKALGEPTEIKNWLAASLDKTIRLQLNPPAELKALSALPGPDWIKQS